MTNPASAIGDARHELDDRARQLDQLRHENGTLRTELDRIEPLIGAAMLTVTAFRLRDQDGLTGALRLLVRAIALFEEHRACA